MLPSYSSTRTLSRVKGGVIMQLVPLLDDAKVFPVRHIVWHNGHWILRKRKEKSYIYIYDVHDVHYECMIHLLYLSGKYKNIVSWDECTIRYFFVLLPLEISAKQNSLTLRTLCKEEKAASISRCFIQVKSFTWATLKSILPRERKREKEIKFLKTRKERRNTQLSISPFYILLFQVSEKQCYTLTFVELTKR